MSNRTEQAIKDGEVYYCPNCKKVQPIELTYFDPDNNSEPTLIACLICREGIGFIDNL